jgi:hypothetical protein
MLQRYMADTKALSLPVHKWLAWSGLLVALSLGAGVAGLERQLNINELWALICVAKPFPEHFADVRNDLVHPPNIYLLERLWLQTFGPRDGATKLLPVVLNIPTIVLFTWLATRVTPHWRLGSFLFASVYLQPGTAPTQVRMYGLCLCWVVAAILLWDRWRRDPRPAWLGAWAVVMILLIYTHYIGLLLLAAFVAANWFYGARRWAFAGAALAAGLTFLPWLLYVLPVYLDRGLYMNLAWVKREPHVAVAQMPVEFLGYIAPSENLFPGLGWLHPWTLRIAEEIAAGLVHVVLVLAAWRGIRRLPCQTDARDGMARWLWPMMLLVAVPAALLYAFSLLSTPAFHARFLTGTLPAYWLSLVLLGEIGGRPGRSILYGIILPWALMSSVVAVFESRVPSPVRRATLEVAPEARSGDLILCDKFTEAAVYWEWTRRLGRSGRLEALEPGEHWLSQVPKKRLEQLDLHGVDRVWFFSGDETKAKLVPEFFRARGFAPQTRLHDESVTLMSFTKTDQT